MMVLAAFYCADYFNLYRTYYLPAPLHSTLYSSSDTLADIRTFFAMISQMC